MTDLADWVSKEVNDALLYMVIFRFFFFPLCRWKKKLTDEKEYIDLRQNTVLFFFLKKQKNKLDPLADQNDKIYELSLTHQNMARPQALHRYKDHRCSRLANMYQKCCTDLLSGQRISLRSLEK